VTAEFSARTRQELLDRAERQLFDLVVVGGGITGAAVARDAALRGLNVVLCEKGDFGEGTSSRSSKLIHGGFRYLQQLQFGLVRESCQERSLLSQTLAPHRVKPLPFLFPVYKTHKHRAWMLHGALSVYDRMDRASQPHRHLSADELLRLRPELSPRGLEGGALYYDAVTDDAHLTLDTARGAWEAGAAVLSYAEVTEFYATRFGLEAVEVRERLSGRVLRARARVAVVAAGPWTDVVRGRCAARPPMLRVTQGSHCVFRRERVPGAEAVVALHPGDRRPLFAFPWRDVIIAGTTDTDYSGGLEEVRASRADVDYILEALNHTLPGLQLTPADVVGTYSGLRPLLRQEGVRESLVSREHVIREEAPGIITVAGGKLTTHRRMAEEVVNRVVRLLPPAGPPRTAVTPLPFCEGDEVAFAVRQQMALTLSDLVERRLWLGLRDAAGGLERLDELSRAQGAELGWSEEERQAQVAAARPGLEGSLAWAAVDSAKRSC